MASQEQEQQTRDLVIQQLSELNDQELSQLERSDLGNDLNFKHGTPYFDRLLRLYHSLSGADLSDVPFNALTRVVQALQQTRAILQQVREFSVAKYSNNLLAQRESLVTQARDQYDAAFDAVTPILAFAVRKGTDFERLENQARQLLAVMQDTASKGTKTLEDTMKASQEALDQVRAVAQEAGVSQHSIHFKDQADRDESSSIPWLCATAALALVTIVAGTLLVWFYLLSVPALTPSQSVQLAIPKLFIFSVLVTATIWCGRTYKAYRHNAVVNRHRQHALATFQTFAKAAADQATKDAVLLQATQCIFSQQPTGYIQSEPEPTALPISEMMRAVNKS